MGSTSVSHPPASDPLRCCLLGLEAHRLDSCHLGRGSRDPLESQTPEKSLLFASHVDQRGVGQTEWDRTVLWSRFSLLPSTTSSPLRLVHYCSASCFDLHRYHHRRAGSSTSGASRSHSLAQTCFSSYMGGFLSWEMPSNTDIRENLSFFSYSTKYISHLSLT